MAHGGGPEALHIVNAVHHKPVAHHAVLIQDGAGLVSDGWDVLREYAARYPDKLRPEGARREMPKVPGYQSREEKPEPAKKLPDLLSLSKEGSGLTDDQIAILRTLTDEPMLVDDLIEATQIPARRVLSALTMLEIEDHVLQFPGKRYARNVVLSES